MTGRAAEVVAVSALAVVLTLAIAAPILRAPSERIFGMEIVGRHRDPFTVMEQFGRPIVVGIYLQPLTDIPGALLARAFGPVAAYNWLVLLTFPLSAIAAYLLARHLGLSAAGATIAAIAFAFSPFHLAQAAYHPHVAQTQWVALYLLALWRCLDDATPGAVGLLVASTIGVTLSNYYGGLIAAVITPVAVAAYWFFVARRLRDRSRRLAITAGALAVIAGGGAGYAWYAARAVVINRAAFGFARDDLFRFSAKWWSYLVPPIEHPLLGAIAARVWGGAGVQEGLLEQQVSLGWGVVALGFVAAVAWLIRDRRMPAREAPGLLSPVPVLAAVAAVSLVCSLSPERVIGPFTFVRPSAWLYGVVPMFRSYARFGVVVQLMAALLAGVGAEYLWLAKRRIACVALVSIAAFEYAVWPPALSRDVLPTAAHRWLARLPGLVHALDCAPITQESESIQWLTGGRISLRQGRFDDCLEPNLAAKLSAAGYTHLLVRRRSSERQWFASRRLPEGLQAVAGFDDGQVFAVTARAPLVYTAAMTAFHSREFNDAWSWRWMGPRASWIAVNSSDRPVAAVADVEMTAFRGARRLTLLLDGREVQTLVVDEERRINRIGPLMLTPGGHALAFEPAEPPTVADAVLHNGDARPLSFGLGSWRWVVEGEYP